MNRILMKGWILVSAAVLVLGLSVELAIPAGAAGFEFRPSQLIYIRAEMISGCDDPAFESRLREFFLKSKVFYVTNDITQADFVFLAYTDYRMRTIELECDQPWKPCSKESRYLAYAEGFAVSPDEYLKGFENRDDLRGKAHWQWMVGSTSRISSPERRSRNLVKAFHEQTIHRTASR